VDQELLTAVEAGADPEQVSKKGMTTVKFISPEQ
jgi:hypothetical protein